MLHVVARLLGSKGWLSSTLPRLLSWISTGTLKMITQEFLKKLVRYNSETGIFTWVVGMGRVIAGQQAGTLRKDGRCQIRICGKIYFAHRLAWLYTHGDFFGIVDHINHNQADNRIANLRLADATESVCNRRARKNSMTGVKGVSWHAARNNWRVCIQHKGKSHSRSFGSFTDAVKYRKEIGMQMHGDFSCEGAYCG